MTVKQKYINNIRSIFFLVLLLLAGCIQHKKEEILKVGFGKANLTQACIFEDPVPVNQKSRPENLYIREEKFAISDRVEGRWRPGSGGIRKLVDSLFVTAMYGEDQNGPWAIIAIDECILSYKQTDNLQYPLINELGIPKERIVILPSHGHAIPEMKPEKYQKAVFDAVKQARENMSEVETASLNIKVDSKKYLINRRIHINGIGSRTVMFNDNCVVHDNYLDATGHIWDWVKNLGVNPKEYLDKDKEYITDGEVDDKLQAIFIRNKKSGKLMGSFVRFAAHAVIVSAKVVNGDVSADFPGYMKRKIEGELGGITLFGQGPCGDLRPLNKEYSHDFAKEYGNILADKIIQDYNNLKWLPLTKLEYYIEPVKIPLIENLFLSEEEVETEMEKVEKLFDQETNPGEKRKLQNKFWQLYRTANVYNMVRPEWKEKNQLSIFLFAIRLNDNVIVATQGEVFTRIGKKMLEPYKAENPVLVSIANEYVSYLPTDEERLKGGYEPSVTIMASGSPDILIQSAHKLLNRIYGE